MSSYILKFRKSIRGVFLFAFANKGGKLKFLRLGKNLPGHIAEFIGLGNNINKPQNKLTFADIESAGMVKNISIKHGYELRCEAEIDSPLSKKRREMKERRAKFREAHKNRQDYIFNMTDLCRYFNAENVADLNRQIYENTNCGASISLYLLNGKTYHNGEKGWNRLTFDHLLQGFTIQTIIEGSDATVDSDRFVLPVKKSDIEKWIDYMETEADFLWREANTNEFNGGKNEN